ncbi:Vegetative incompatibility protein HET-E-1 [Ceratocystis platani]|uniref:Vegetative incompatibility protein HET-E-1 n=1 Tax=Ceratocystis fimbriata f. sp. platani TaxID=88771 RepID=A0A0F8B7Y0_CERFI|nr:Vegetative incompatibility protein HET-E-1 [Ceratocystis platani]
MGIVDTAIRAAPEAAVIWATVCLGIEVLKNPITEALENRQGIQYVLGRIEWYWNLTSLLLDENKKNTAATVLRDALEESITQLFQQLLSYQIRSICLYRRNKVVGFIRDVFLIDDWAGQVNSIKKAEKAVQHDIEQYNTQESQQQMQKLNDSTAAMQANVANIHTAVQSLAEQQAKAREDDKNNECLRDLCVTDPRMDKKNIENKKGGLLRDSYKWILDHQGFKKFKNEADSRILWIKGDPGKGKTMLLCGIINELEEDQSTWETLAKLKSFPPGLDALYGQMLKEISESPHAQLYKEVIAKVLVVYRPITLEELRAMVEALKDFNIKDIEEIVASLLRAMAVLWHQWSSQMMDSD